MWIIWNPTISILLSRNPCQWFDLQLLQYEQCDTGKSTLCTYWVVVNDKSTEGEATVTLKIAEEYSGATTMGCLWVSQLGWHCIFEESVQAWPVTNAQSHSRMAGNQEGENFFNRSSLSSELKLWMENSKLPWLTRIACWTEEFEGWISWVVKRQLSIHSYIPLEVNTNVTAANISGLLSHP